MLKLRLSSEHTFRRKVLLGVACSITLLLAGASAASGRGEAIAPDGTIGVASTEDFRTVFLISPETGAVAKVRAPDVMAGVDISPDGSRLAISGVKGIWVFARSGARARRLPIAPSTTTQSFGEVRWAPDGKRFVYVDGGGLFITTVTGSKRKRLLAGGDLHEPDWSPRGGLIAFVRDPSYPKDGPIQLVRSDGRGLRSIVRGVQPDISPNGSKLAFSRGENVYVMPLAGGRPRLVVHKAAHPEWSPDGRYLAFTKNVVCFEAGCSGRVFIVRAMGGGARAIGPEIFDIGPLTWSK
jgi:Tol biopolymer transport system component